MLRGAWSCARMRSRAPARLASFFSNPTDGKSILFTRPLFSSTALFWNLLERQAIFAPDLGSSIETQSKRRSIEARRGRSIANSWEKGVTGNSSNCGTHCRKNAVWIQISVVSNLYVPALLGLGNLARFQASLYPKPQNRAPLNGGPQVWWTLFLLLLIASAWLCLQRSRNLAAAF